MVAKQKLSEIDAQGVKSRIKTVSTLSGLANCDFVVEAATENVATKIKIFQELDSVTKKESSML